jgi:VWFA-related protein
MNPPRRRFLAAGLAVCVSGVASARAGQAPTFSSRLEVVRVDALVTENGRVVEGLRPGDFEVRDNGVLQQVDFASVAELPLNVVLALDASASLSGDRLPHLREGGLGLIDALGPDDRAALVTFSHVVSLREALTGETGRISRALRALEPGGQTSLVDAAYAAMTLAPADGASRNLVIVFSDGQDTSSWLRPERVIESARYADATIYSVAVRGTERPRFLRDLTAAAGGSVIEIESTSDLRATLTAVLAEFRQRYVIGFSPRGVAPGGAHTLQIRVRGRRAEVKARAGYVGGR